MGSRPGRVGEQGLLSVCCQLPLQRQELHIFVFRLFLAALVPGTQSACHVLPSSSCGCVCVRLCAMCTDPGPVRSPVFGSHANFLKILLVPLEFTSLYLFPQCAALARTVKAHADPRCAGLRTGPPRPKGAE